MFFIVKHRNSWCLVPIVSEGGSIERGRLLNWMLAGRSTLIYSKVVTWISQRLVLWHECDSLFWRQRRWWNDRYANGNNANDHNTNNNDANDNNAKNNNSNGIYAFDNDYDVTNDVFLDWRKSSARPQDGLEALALVVNKNIFVELKMGWPL